ncbi:MAG TPA: hypothetical protein PK812_12790 [Beijerinckiaceae bacterium]|nr:hypothetical protein [Beijerinckiaceae bacterium]
MSFLKALVFYVIFIFGSLIGQRVGGYERDFVVMLMVALALVPAIFLHVLNRALARGIANVLTSVLVMTCLILAAHFGLAAYLKQIPIAVSPAYAVAGIVASFFYQFTARPRARPLGMPG